MTIDKAIKILEGNIEGNADWWETQLGKSIRLGIEALKEVKKARYGDPALDGELLPGETEGGDNEQGNQGN